MYPISGLQAGLPALRTEIVVANGIHTKGEMMKHSPDLVPGKISTFRMRDQHYHLGDPIGPIAAT